jgi:hypothetical protein
MSKKEKICHEDDPKNVAHYKKNAGVEALAIGLATYTHKYIGPLRQFSYLYVCLVYNY